MGRFEADVGNRIWKYSRFRVEVSQGYPLKSGMHGSLSPITFSIGREWWGLHGRATGIQVLRKGQRIGLAAGSLILSLPAFLGAVAGIFFVYATAVSGGYNGDPVQAVVKLLSSWKGCLIMMACLLFIMHIGLFLYLVIRFAQGLNLPAFAQLYCITIVLLTIGERIRLLIVDGNAFFWFGVFSLPHALCLFVIIWMNRHSSKSHVARGAAVLG